MQLDGSDDRQNDLHTFTGALADALVRLTSRVEEVRADSCLEQGWNAINRSPILGTAIRIMQADHLLQGSTRATDLFRTTTGLDLIFRKSPNSMCKSIWRERPVCAQNCATTTTRQGRVVGWDASRNRLRLEELENRDGDQSQGEGL